MGLPHDPIKVVNFVKTVKDHNPENAGPMVVHCRLVFLLWHIICLSQLFL